MTCFQKIKGDWFHVPRLFNHTTGVVYTSVIVIEESDQSYDNRMHDIRYVKFMCKLLPMKVGKSLPNYAGKIKTAQLSFGEVVVKKAVMNKEIGQSMIF